MEICSLTRLRIRKYRYLPAFLIYTLRSTRQVRRSPGFLGGYLALGPRLAFWTVTSWKDLEAMRAFRASGAHLAAMPKLLLWCDEAAVATIEVSSDAVPEPAEAAARLSREGGRSKVRSPSAAHAAGELWPDKLVPRRGQTLRPA